MRGSQEARYPPGSANCFELLVNSADFLGDPLNRPGAPAIPVSSATPKLTGENRRNHEVEMSAKVKAPPAPVEIKRNERGQFLPGYAPNPAGRPPGGSNSAEKACASASPRP